MKRYSICMPCLKIINNYTTELFVLEDFVEMNFSVLVT